MKTIFFSILTILLIPASQAFAESTASVEINNNFNSSSNNSTSQTSAHTEVTVETDGNVTHYETDEPGNVSVKAKNGESEIKVNGKTVSGTPSSNITKEPSLTPSPTIVKVLTEEQKEKLNQIEEVIETLKDKITSLKVSLSSLFD